MGTRINSNNLFSRESNRGSLTFKHPIPLFNISKIVSILIISAILSAFFLSINATEITALTYSSQDNSIEIPLNPLQISNNIQIDPILHRNSLINLVFTTPTSYGNLYAFIYLNALEDGENVSSFPHFILTLGMKVLETGGYSWSMIYEDSWNTYLSQLSKNEIKKFYIMIRNAPNENGVLVYTKQYNNITTLPELAELIVMPTWIIQSEPKQIRYIDIRYYNVQKTSSTIPFVISFKSIIPYPYSVLRTTPPRINIRLSNNKDSEICLFSSIEVFKYRQQIPQEYDTCSVSLSMGQIINRCPNFMNNIPEDASFGMSFHISWDLGNTDNIYYSINGYIPPVNFLYLSSKIIVSSSLHIENISTGQNNHVYPLPLSKPLTLSESTISLTLDLVGRPYTIETTPIRYPLICSFNAYYFNIDPLTNIPVHTDTGGYIPFSIYLQPVTLLPEYMIAQTPPSYSIPLPLIFQNAVSTQSDYMSINFTECYEDVPILETSLPSTSVHLGHLPAEPSRFINIEKTHGLSNVGTRMSKYNLNDPDYAGVFHVIGNTLYVGPSPPLDYSVSCTIDGKYRLENRSITDEKTFTLILSQSTILDFPINDGMTSSYTNYIVDIPISDLITELRTQYSIPIETRIDGLYNIYATVERINVPPELSDKRKSLSPFTLCADGLTGPQCRQDKRCLKEYNMLNQCNNDNGYVEYNTTLNECNTKCTCDNDLFGTECQQSPLCQTTAQNDYNNCNGNGYIRYDGYRHVCYETCTCFDPDNWSGSQCQIKNPRCDHVSPQPQPANCINYGISEVLYDSETGKCISKCKCQGKWQGNLCETCGIQCFHGGISDFLCQSMTPLPRPCQCQDPYVGPYCQYKYIDIPLDITNYVLPFWLEDFTRNNDITSQVSDLINSIRNAILIDIGEYDIEQGMFTNIHDVQYSTIYRKDPVSRVSIPFEMITYSNKVCGKGTPNEINIASSLHLNIRITVGEGLDTISNEILLWKTKMIENQSKLMLNIHSIFSNHGIYYIGMTSDTLICNDKCINEYNSHNNCSNNGVILQSTSSGDDDDDDGICDLECSCSHGWGGHNCSEAISCSMIQDMYVDECDLSKYIMYTNIDLDTGLCRGFCACPVSLDYVITNNDIDIANTSIIDTDIISPVLFTPQQQECNGHGAYKVDFDTDTCGSECDCDHGWYGNECQHSIHCQSIIESYDNCSSHGTVRYNPTTKQCDIQCTCDDTSLWTGTTCSQDVECSDSSILLRCDPNGYVTKTTEQQPPNNGATDQCNSYCSCRYGYTGKWCHICDTVCYMGEPNINAHCQKDLEHTMACSCQRNALGRFCQYYSIPTQYTIRNRILPSWIINSINTNTYHNSKMKEFIDTLILKINRLFNYNNDDNILMNMYDINLPLLYHKDSIERTIIPLSGMSYAWTVCHNNNDDNDDDDDDDDNVIMIPSTLKFTIYTRTGENSKTIKQDINKMSQRWEYFKNNMDMATMISSLFDEYGIERLNYNNINCGGYNDGENDVDFEPEKPVFDDDEEEELSSNIAIYWSYNNNNSIMWIYSIISIILVLFIAF